MTVENTKPEWEMEWAIKLIDLAFEVKRGDKVPIPKLIADLRDLLASQRHQLKEQVVAAMGEWDIDSSAIRARIMEVFDKEV